MIPTANIYFGNHPTQRIRDWDAWKARFLLKHMVRQGIQQRGNSDAAPLEAVIRQGAWHILCDGPGCRGSEYAWEEGLMMCASCLNAHLGHQFRQTAFPRHRGAIEEILELRAIPNRNWEPPETLDDLLAENQEHAAELLT